ncbi:hypothetical protein IIB50_00915 [Patescibacteria group bacterium]|nr:hypothetical protein [Patescibacteria group bacterium]
MYKKLVALLAFAMLLGGCVYDGGGLAITQDSVISFAGSKTIVTVTNKTVCHLHLLNDVGKVIAKIPKYGIATVRHSRMSVSRRHDEFNLIVVAYNTKGDRVGNQARSFRINKRGGIKTVIWNVRKVGCSS